MRAPLAVTGPQVGPPPGRKPRGTPDPLRLGAV